MKVLLQPWLLAAAVAGAAAAPEAPSAPADEPQTQAAKVLLLGRDDEVPRAYAWQVGDALKHLPEGHRLRLLLQEIFNQSTGQVQLMVVRITAVDAEGRPDGPETHWVPWQGLQRRVHYRAGVRHGEESFFSRDGGERLYVHKSIPWEEGVVHGVVKLFYPDGKVLSEAPHVRGVLEGESRSYARDGFVTRSVRYKAGQRDGELVEHWPRTRKIKQSVPYRMGKVHGTVRQHYESGQLKREVQVWEDCFHGVDREYYEDGELRKMTWWVLDEEVSEAEFAQRYRVPPETQPATRPAGAASAPAGGEGSP